MFYHMHLREASRPRQDRARVNRDYLLGRSAALRACLDGCFASPEGAEAPLNDFECNLKSSKLTARTHAGVAQSRTNARACNELG